MRKTTIKARIRPKAINFRVDKDCDKLVHNGHKDNYQHCHEKRQRMDDLKTTNTILQS